MEVFPSPVSIVMFTGQWKGSDRPRHADPYPQVEELRSELLRTKQERAELQRTRPEAFHPGALQHGNHLDGEEAERRRRAPGTQCASPSTSAREVAEAADFFGL